MRSTSILASCFLLSCAAACGDAREEEASSAEPPAAVAPPLEAGVAEIDLGPLGTGTVAFEIPFGALGFSIVVEGTEPSGAEFGVMRITDPNGRVVHDAAKALAGKGQRSTLGTRTIVRNVPGDDATMDVVPGRWTMQVAEAGPRGMRARVLVQRSGDGAFHGGALNLHLHLVERLNIDDVSIDTAHPETDPVLGQNVDAFFALLESEVGIERGEVVFHRSSLEPGISMWDDLGATTAGHTASSAELHVVLVNLIMDPLTKQYPLAFAPQPGAARLFGRRESLVVMSMRGAPELNAKTLLHEIGHFAGLPHTSESASVVDGFADTPQCDRPDVGPCDDASNLMFPFALDGSAKLSESQKRVFRGATFYDAYPPGAQRTQSRTMPASATRRSPTAALPHGWCGYTASAR